MIPNSKGFYEYLPENYYSESQSYPLLIFIHGVGELGNGGSDLYLVSQVGTPKLISQGRFPTSFSAGGQSYKFIVISPQFVSWPSSPDIQGVIDYAVRRYRVNTSKIYLTGLSMGGGASWEYAGYSSEYANRIAALVPVCGASSPDSRRAGVMAAANLPIWATHNVGDPTVPSYLTADYANLINSLNPNPRVKTTIFQNAFWHDAWTTTYDPNYRENGMNVYEWMLQYSRGNSPEPTNPAPAPAPISGSNNIPGKIESENYSNMSGVNTDNSFDGGGGRYVGWIDAGDWIDYNVNVNSSGTYSVNFRVASAYNGARFQLKKSDGSVLSTITVPQTWGWQAWANVTATVQLEAGGQTLRISSLQSNWNLNWIEFTQNSNSNPNIPGRVEAESFSNMNGIQTQAVSDDGGGQNVGWIDWNDWMDYNINVGSAGNYVVYMRVASPYSGGKVQIRNGNGNTLATAGIPQTWGFQSWTTISTVIPLQAGYQTLRVYSQHSGWNFNWMDFGYVSSLNSSDVMEVATTTASTAIAGAEIDKPGARDVIKMYPNPVKDKFSLQLTNQYTGVMNVQIVDQNGSVRKELKLAKNQVFSQHSIPAQGLPAGTYFLRIQIGTWKTTQKLVKL
jgi:endoglucanase